MTMGDPEASDPQGPWYMPTPEAVGGDDWEAAHREYSQWERVQESIGGTIPPRAEYVATAGGLIDTNGPVNPQIDPAPRANPLFFALLGFALLWTVTR